MSIRKREWKTSKGEPREAWIVDYVDQLGKRHIRTFERKREADKYAGRVSVEVSEGAHTPNSTSITVSDAGQLWLQTAENNGLERSTIDQYRQHLTFHIVPFLGRRKLSELSAPMVRDFEDKLRNGTPPSGHGESAPRSVALTRKIIVSLGSLVSDAQERGLVSRNVVRDLRGRRTRGKERRAERRQKGKLKVGLDIPTRQEIKAIVDALQGRWRPILLTAIFTGLRASELRGLTWKDVDFDKCEIHVRQRADRYGHIGAPKSEAGDRKVPVPPIVLNTLREWKLACPNRELNLVFPNGSGNIEALANVINRGLIPVQITAGVVSASGKAKYTGMHALRHFYASWCINRRADGGLELPPKMVQERLGHSSIVMTMDRYGHLFPSGDHASELAAAEQTLLA